jgi:hypothetical protein
MAVDRGRGDPASWDLMPATALVIVPFLLLGNRTHATKTQMALGSAFPEALQTLAKLRKHNPRSPHSRLALDRSSCAEWRYYNLYHPDKARTAASMRHFSARCTKTWNSIVVQLERGLELARARNYAVFGRAGSVEELERRLPPSLVIEDRVTVGKGAQFVVSVKRR